MKITQLFTEQKEREIEFDTPAFFKEDSYTKVAVYSEAKVVSVTAIDNEYFNVRMSSISQFSNFINLITKATRITKEEFDVAMTEAFMDIVGEEIAPNSLTESIPY